MEQISELGQFSCLNTLSRLSGLKFFMDIKFSRLSRGNSEVVVEVNEKKT